MKNPHWRKCVINGDSRDVIKRIPDNSIDFILTDPPYNLGQHSTGNIPLPGRSAMNNDVAEWDMIDFNPEEWADEFIRILKPSGNLFIFTSYNQIGRWHACLDHKFDTTNFMVWHKTNPAPKIFKAGFLNSCELVFTCWNKGHTWNFISQAEMHNFIESPICMRPERLSSPKHPAQKPVVILKKMIEIATRQDDVIFDPFMGVGSTGVAALEMNRKFIGVEIDNTYCLAAKRRIEEVLIKNINYQNLGEKMDNNELNEPQVAYQNSLFSLSDFICELDEDEQQEGSRASGLAPLLKWPGGKEKELKYILPNLPSHKRFIEPFVGGGSVFMGINSSEYLINDLSTELMGLYKCISAEDLEFYRLAEEINESWQNVETFFQSCNELIEVYLAYRKRLINPEKLKTDVKEYCKKRKEEIENILGHSFSDSRSILFAEMEKNLSRKMQRMRQLEEERHELPMGDIYDNIETAMKSALYMYYRRVYNEMLKSSLTDNSQRLSALFMFIRNYAYSGMFRYSSKGEFNVPYGGIAYNRKFMTKKLSYYKSGQVLAHFSRSSIYNLDFETFLREASPRHDDFIFLDPPYDSEFSTYAQNSFTRDDQIRLAEFLTGECKAKWMMIIKNTDFIYSLYNKKGINIQMFDKEYLVSFMNRNDKKVTHLLIKNY